MLSTVKRTSVRRRTPCVWRTNATDTSSLQASGRDEERAKIPRVTMTRGSIRVRTWDYPASIAETYAILRGVELKYGRIRDFRWMRVGVHLTMFVSVSLFNITPNGVRTRTCVRYTKAYSGPHSILRNL